MQKFLSVSISGISWQEVNVEVDVNKWMGQFNIVWMTDTAIQESRERVRSAIKNSGFKFPSGARITVNLAPSDIKKKWSLYDLAIALGILSKELNFDEEIIKNSIFLWELALDGSLRGVNWVLPATIFAMNNKKKFLFLPEDNYSEASIIPNIEIIPVKNLKEAIQFLTKEKNFAEINITPETKTEEENIFIDFKNILGQNLAKRAIMIAAAGGHNIILQWPPWSGKTMLAKALPSILPDLELEEKIEVSQIYSVAGLLNKKQPIINKRPFRTIHHTASEVSIIGGWRNSKPWEISLAHKWILFLDEFLEFPKSILETLRQPLEDWKITINRIEQSAEYPAKFALVGALNPCPCGFLGDKEKTCVCSQSAIERYRSKLSWPIMDRIDIFINVPRISITELRNQNTENQISSEEIKKTIIKAKNLQKERFKNTKIFANSDMDNEAIEKFAKIKNDAREIAITSTEKLQLSTRVYYRILRLARTIADIDNSEFVEVRHILEALSYRWNN